MGGFRCAMLLAVALVNLATGAVPARADIAQSRQRLEAVRQRLQATSRSLKEKETAERSLLRDLAEVQEELTRLSADRASLFRETERIRGQLVRVRRAADDSRQKIAALQERVERRLVALYKTGASGPLRILLSSSSPTEMAQQHHYMSRLVRHDRDLLDTYRQEVRRLEQSLKELAALRKRQAELLAEMEQSRQMLEEAGRLKEELLVRVRQDKRVLTARMEELKEDAAKLEALIKKLESAKKGEYIDQNKLMARQKGSLPWPIRGDVVVGFGSQRHPELGTLFESHGIEIAASGEEPVTAVWDGRVVFADLFKGYGKLIIVDHGGGYHSLYANASRLVKKSGDAVRKGEILAYAGYPGTRSVYLEIRHRGAPVDPLAWLAPRKKSSDRRTR